MNLLVVLPVLHLTHGFLKVFISLRGWQEEKKKAEFSYLIAFEIRHTKKIKLHCKAAGCVHEKGNISTYKKYMHAPFGSLFPRYFPK